MTYDTINDAVTIPGKGEGTPQTENETEGTGPSHQCEGPVPINANSARQDASPHQFFYLRRQDGGS